MKKFYDQVVNQGKIEMIDELIAEDFVEHETLPGAANDRQSVKDWFMMLKTGFPDIKFEVKDITAQDGKVWALIQITGTNTGQFMGMPATGKKIDVQGFDLVQLKAGKAIAHWGVTQELQMMQQLGMIPMPEETADK